MSRLSELVPDTDVRNPPSIEEVNVKGFPHVVKQYPITNLCTCLMEYLFVFHSFVLCIIPFMSSFIKLFALTLRALSAEKIHIKSLKSYLLPGLDLLSF